MSYILSFIFAVTTLLLILNLIHFAESEETGSPSNLNKNYYNKRNTVLTVYIVLLLVLSYLLTGMFH